MGVPVGVRMQPEMLDEVDRLCAEWHETRPEVIRRLLADAFIQAGKELVEEAAMEEAKDEPRQ